MQLLNSTHVPCLQSDYISNCLYHQPIVPSPTLDICQRAHIDASDLHSLKEPPNLKAHHSMSLNDKSIWDRVPSRISRSPRRHRDLGLSNRKGVPNTPPHPWQRIIFDGYCHSKERFYWQTQKSKIPNCGSWQSGPT